VIATLGATFPPGCALARGPQCRLRPWTLEQSAGLVIVG